MGILIWILLGILAVCLDIKKIIKELDTNMNFRINLQDIIMYLITIFGGLFSLIYFFLDINNNILEKIHICTIKKDVYGDIEIN